MLPLTSIKQALGQPNVSQFGGPCSPGTQHPCHHHSVPLAPFIPVYPQPTSLSLVMSQEPWGSFGMCDCSDLPLKEGQVTGLVLRHVPAQSWNRREASARAVALRGTWRMQVPQPTSGPWMPPPALLPSCLCPPAQLCLLALAPASTTIPLNAAASSHRIQAKAGLKPPGEKR